MHKLREFLRVEYPEIFKPGDEIVFVQFQMMMIQMVLIFGSWQVVAKLGENIHWYLIQFTEGKNYPIRPVVAAWMWDVASAKLWRLLQMHTRPWPQVDCRL